MTTLELIKMTLRKLDRPTDNDTVALYKERLLGYLNEAMLDLTAELRPWRRDTLAVTSGQADLSGLPRVCLKVLAARIDGQRRLFYYGATRSTLLFPGVGDGTVGSTTRPSAASCFPTGPGSSWATATRRRTCISTRGRNTT